MSDSDMFIHRRFFERSDMVAYVLDTISERDAFFRWRDGYIVPCASYGLACSASSEANTKSSTGACNLSWRKVMCWGLGLAIGLALGVALVMNLAHSRDNRLIITKTVPAKRIMQSPKNSEIVYTVSRGETLWDICKQVYGSGKMAPALARFNGLKSRHSLRSGRLIRIPSREALNKYR